MTMTTPGKFHLMWCYVMLAEGAIMLMMSTTAFAAYSQNFACGSRGSSSSSSSSSGNIAWRPLPHVDISPALNRRDALVRGSAGAAASLLLPTAASASTDAADRKTLALSQSPLSSSTTSRSVISVDGHPVIPVWPTWGGGRVVPVSLHDGTDGGGSHHCDPYLLLAHHKHWFDPRDPLRGPFKTVGSALNLPYVDVEGFSMHPHRGFDILTYILDGSHGFRHRDSLGGERTYRGGTAQWMRTGSGVLHEEFWETRDDRRTEIELFQIWINLPSGQKFDEPAVVYVGEGTEHPWRHTGADGGEGGHGVWVRDVGGTLDRATLGERDGSSTDSGGGIVRPRPPLTLRHARLDPGAEWSVSTPRGHSAVLYVREGAASLPADGVSVPALRTATFAPDGDNIVIRNDSPAAQGRSFFGGGNNSKKVLDVLLLTGEPLGEPVALGGPIVMNTQGELDDAYRQLRNGTFLNREDAMRKQRQRAAGVHPRV